MELSCGLRGGFPNIKKLKEFPFRPCESRCGWLGGGGWGERKTAQVLQLQLCRAAPSASLWLSLQRWLAQRDLLSWERVSGACRESDPEMSTLLLWAADGNQVSCLIRAVSNTLFAPPRDAQAPRLYSRSHAYLKRTKRNLPRIWSRD